MTYYYNCNVYLCRDRTYARVASYSRASRVQHKPITSRQAAPAAAATLRTLLTLLRTWCGRLTTQVLNDCS